MRLLEVRKSFEDLYAKYYLDLIEVHKLRARELGIVDEVCENYTEERALGHLTDGVHRGRFILNECNEFVGMVTYKVLEEDSDYVLFVDALFVDEKYRNRGIATTVLEYFKSKYKIVRLDCWYDLPAHILYEELGFKEISRTDEYVIYEFRHLC